MDIYSYIAKHGITHEQYEKELADEAHEASLVAAQDEWEASFGDIPTVRTPQELLDFVSNPENKGKAVKVENEKSESLGQPSRSETTLNQTGSSSALRGNSCPKPEKPKKI